MADTDDVAARAAARPEPRGEPEPVSVSFNDGSRPRAAGDMVEWVAYGVKRYGHIQARVVPGIWGVRTVAGEDELACDIDLIDSEHSAREPRGEPRDETVPPPGFRPHYKDARYCHRDDPSASQWHTLAEAWAIYDREHAPSQPSAPAPATVLPVAPAEGYENWVRWEAERRGTPTRGAPEPALAFDAATGELLLRVLMVAGRWSDGVDPLDDSEVHDAAKLIADVRRQLRSGPTRGAAPEPSEVERLTDAEVAEALRQVPPSVVLALVKEHTGRIACMHCGLIPPAGEEHWRVCEKHPARVQMDELYAKLVRVADDKRAVVSALATAEARIAELERGAPAAAREPSEVSDLAAWCADINAGIAREAALTDALAAAEARIEGLLLENECAANLVGEMQADARAAEARETAPREAARGIKGHVIDDQAGRNALRRLCAALDAPGEHAAAPRPTRDPEDYANMRTTAESLRQELLAVKQALGIERDEDATAAIHRLGYAQQRPTRDESGEAVAQAALRQLIDAVTRVCDWGDGTRVANAIDAAEAYLAGNDYAPGEHAAAPLVGPGTGQCGSPDCPTFIVCRHGLRSALATAEARIAELERGAPAAAREPARDQCGSPDCPTQIVCACRLGAAREPSEVKHG